MESDQRRQGSQAAWKYPHRVRTEGAISYFNLIGSICFVPALMVLLFVPIPSTRYLVVLCAILLISGIALWRALVTGLLRVTFEREAVEWRTLFKLRRIATEEVCLLRRARRWGGRLDGHYAQIEILTPHRALTFAMSLNESSQYWEWLCDRCDHAIIFDDLESEAAGPRCGDLPVSSPSAHSMLRRMAAKYLAEIALYAALMAGIGLVEINAWARNPSRTSAVEILAVLIIAIIVFKTLQLIRQLVNIRRMKMRLSDMRVE